MVNAYGAAPAVGGTEKGVALLTRHLVDRGFDIAILQAFPGAALPGISTTVLHDADGRTDRLRWLSNHVGDGLSWPSRALVEVVDAHTPELVHTHNLQGMGTGLWEICRSRGIPVVHTLHDYHLLCPRVTLMRSSGVPCQPHPALCGLRTRRMMRWSGGVLQLAGVSAFLIRAHRHLFPDIPTHVVRNPSEPLPAAHYSPPASPPRTIGYLGSLTPEKGVDLLLEAASSLAALGISLRIAGSGRLAPEVAAAAQKQGGVSFEGVVSGTRKAEFLDACDIGIIPSVWAEPGAPTQTMVEWLAARRPTLVSRRGGLGEVVDEFAGAVGLVPTVDGIVSAVAELVEPNRWVEAVEAVRPLQVEGQVDRWVEQYLQIYDSATAELVP
jgi:glycosyltransferase involved in cell wall biosynthesis